MKKRKFQSTHPHGVRHRSTNGYDKAITVSIHAPTRGATFANFISKPTFKFQSTHPHGVRHESTLRIFTRLRFNPRTHTGCDYFCGINYYRYVQFQSTHPHGVRLRLIFCHPPYMRVSIHAPTRGATILPPVLSARASSCFNPRTHTGCDLPVGRVRIPGGVSIHAPTRGATTSSASHPPVPSCFNPRTHTGCDSLNTHLLAQ